MPGLPLGGGDPTFDEYDEFAPDHLPDPGDFLAGHEVLTGEAHVDFHELTRDLFEERGVYDVTFNYNLARLNLDTRHESAGFRYAREAEDPGVLRAEFTPTTEFCPQSETLTVGAFRAWNGLADRHDYDVVRVRVDGMHHDADAINEVLAGLESAFRETGEVPAPGDVVAPDAGGVDGGSSASEQRDPPRSPF